MSRRGILYSRPMVIALRDGLKTQTRRVIKNTVWYACLTGDCPHTYSHECDAWFRENGCPYGKPGDLTYCKEMVIPRSRGGGNIHYAADEPESELPAYSKFYGGWKPSILMREDEARLWFRLVDVRAQRIRDISEADARAEGVAPAADGSYVTAYRELWNRINAAPSAVKERVGDKIITTHYVSYPWDGDSYQTLEHRGKPHEIEPNPFVFALTLEPVDPPAKDQPQPSQEGTQCTLPL